MPQTIDRETANRAHPTTVILPTEEEHAEQARRRLRIVGIAALAGVGALALAGGVWYAYRAGWIGSPPRGRARRTLDAVRHGFDAAGETFDSVGGSLRRGYDAAAERLRSMKAA